MDEAAVINLVEQRMQRTFPPPPVMPPPMVSPPALPPPPMLPYAPPPAQAPSGGAWPVPKTLQACAFHFSRKGCTVRDCARSHVVPDHERPPRGACYSYFYTKLCPRQRGNQCKFNHDDVHPSCPK